MKVFAVDESESDLNLLVASIKAGAPDAEVSAFTSSAVALDAFESARPQVVFCDSSFVGKGAAEFVKEIRKIEKETNIVFVSAPDCRDEAIFLHVSGYISKPVSEEAVKKQLSNLLYPVAVPPSRAYIKTFGNFEIFVNGTPVVFRRLKSKEMLAYLVDRRGSSVTKKELCALLFPNDYSSKKQNYFAQIYRSLKEALKSCGCGDILVKHVNSYSVDVSAFSCDSYEYLNGDTHAINKYRGEYMEQFAWATACKKKFR